MSAENPTWLDHYFLVAKKGPSEKLRQLMGLGSLSATDARTAVIALFNNATDARKTTMPNTEDVTFTAYSDATGWVEIDLCFTKKPSAGGDKLTVFFEGVRRVPAPTPERSL